MHHKPEVEKTMKEAAAKVHSDAQAGFADWVAKSLKAGAGPAHKWTSQRTKAPPLPDSVKSEEGWIIHQINRS